MNQWFVWGIRHALAPHALPSPKATSYKAVTAETGLTLLELLVSIVVVSVLSAIALPSFLNFSSRARHSEAKITLSSILRGQQSYYVANGEFSGNIRDLSLGISDSENYRYKTHAFTNHQTLEGVQVSGATAIAEPLTTVRGYMGKVWVDTSLESPRMGTVLCEGNIGETYFMDGQTYCR